MDLCLRYILVQGFLNLSTIGNGIRLSFDGEAATVHWKMPSSIPEFYPEAAKIKFCTPFSYYNEKCL